MSEAVPNNMTATADEASSNASTVTTLEALQKQSSHTRRMRPPVVLHEAAGADEPRVPLRSGPREGGLRATNPEKLAHRESRLGLRGLFSRHKASGQDVRASIVDFSSWPYFHTPRSESALPKNPHAASSSLSVVPQEPEPKTDLPVAPTPDRSTPTPTLHGQQAPVTATQPTESAVPLIGTPSTTKAKKPAVPLRSRTPISSSRAVRGSLATWDPPPLFQAYPQAIKHAQLPICTTSIEVLMRLQGSVGGVDAAAREADSLEDGVEKLAEKAKRRHRRNTSGSSMKLDWVTKIYVLVTSGYLLQYSAEGSFDRLPEKILPISRDSAAFASDLIPGRHWVLRVSSSMDVDGSQTNDSRSLFSRLPFRAAERRQATTFLMVFESAEEMESWISILRREIEQLGGKKHLSETGKPKAENGVVDPRFQVNHRTLVVRDPERFSRILSPSDVAHIPRRTPREGNQHQHLEAPSPAATMSLPDRDPLSDDMSTTNSIYSQDGRQLESLRDSAGNRFSYISSGQRTIVTSDSSSPPCSPVRNSFTSNHNAQTDEQQGTTATSTSTPSPPPPPPTQPQPAPESPDARPAVRLRTNAAAILERRQSMQVMTSSQRVADIHMLPTQLPPPQPPPTEALPRLPTSTFSMSKPLPPPVPLRRETNFSLFDAAATIPNFSVPHSASKRYSAVMKTSAAPGMPPTQDLLAHPVPDSTLAAAFSAFPLPPREAPPRLQQSAFGPPSTRNSRRRLPPPSLAFSRPLSIVADHASPSTTSPPLPGEVVVSNAALDDNNPSSPGYGSDVPDTPALFDAWKSPEPVVAKQPSSPTRPVSRRRSGSFSSLSRNSNKPGSSGSDNSYATASEVPVRNSPRRHFSMLALRSVSDSASERIEPRTVVVPKRASMILPLSKYNALSPKLPEDDPRDNWTAPPPPLAAPLTAPLAAPLVPPLAPPPSQPLPQPPSRPQSRGQSQSRTSSLTRLQSRSPARPRSSHGSNGNRGSSDFSFPLPPDNKRASMFVQPSAGVGGRIADGRQTSRPLSLYHATAMSRAGGSVDTGRGRTSIKPEPLATLAVTDASNGSLAPPVMHARARSTSSNGALHRRSPPQLADGPPPAPPPSCALPPLPVKAPEPDPRRRILPV
ncbi:uncharacterized protein SPSK_02985 [Sporothrix schenckii 1099-18]|uniref:PH domain-containing protein n=1 Tax=Sporothrix schenckii 1099-18 TaxID=1397361 RepID=A0A0F2LXZ5_SPOSC|nr:uncharacterized protein SPSK_02985 [Sporothrix schenckii 1099-18]KJR82342.1 hypothetical protein SPSK_02985 [Sporothrix schenckii 1099-18]